MADITQYEPLWGSWYVESLIGEGAFGKVYKVRREEYGKTYYAAVKIISVPTSQAELREKMREERDENSVRSYYHAVVDNILQEISLMASFKGNSNIVSLEDHMVFERMDAIGWDVIIRMELLTSLTDYATPPFPVSEVVKLGKHICRALEICAQRRTIHRDVKPANIFISEFGEYKLGDFGVARQIERTLTMGFAHGTPDYMAPEVAANQAYGASVDTYSLGIVLYKYLNNGRAPFLPEYPRPYPVLPNDRNEAYRRRMSGEPLPWVSLPADQRMIAGVDIEIALNQILQRACAYDPANRFTSATEMREALERLGVQDPAPLTAAPSRPAPLASVVPLPQEPPVQTEHTRSLFEQDFTDRTEYILDDPTYTPPSPPPPPPKKTAANNIRRIIITAAAGVAGVALLVTILIVLLTRINPRVPGSDEDSPSPKTTNATPSPLDPSPEPPGPSKPPAVSPEPPEVSEPPEPSEPPDEPSPEPSESPSPSPSPTPTPSSAPSPSPSPSPSPPPSPSPSPSPLPDEVVFDWSGLARGASSGSFTRQGIDAVAPPAQTYTSLTSLSFNVNNIRDVSPLASPSSFPALRELSLNNNWISDPGPLRALTTLERLYLNHNNISDAGTLAQITSLRQLQLNYNQIGDISPLRSLTNLRQLLITNNQISDVSPLQWLTRLEHLDLSNNRITDISPLASLTGLTTLSLVGNPITDVTPLASLVHLSELHLRGVPLSQEQIDWLRAALPSCWVNTE